MNPTICVNGSCENAPRTPEKAGGTRDPGSYPLCLGRFRRLTGPPRSPNQAAQAAFFFMQGYLVRTLYQAAR